MKKYLLSLGVLLAFNVFAGPFGLEKGMTLAQLQQQGTFRPIPEIPMGYMASTLKSGHPAFEAYMVLVSDTRGLCKVQATGKDVVSSSYGSELRGAFDSIASGLQAKYGTPTSQFDFLQAGSIWKENNEFMMGLARKERILKYFWQTKKGANLPDHLSSIGLIANASGSTKGWVTLSYEFDGADDCIDVSNTKRNTNL